MVNCQNHGQFLNLLILSHWKLNLTNICLRSSRSTTKSNIKQFFEIDLSSFTLINSGAVFESSGWAESKTVPCSYNWPELVGVIEQKKILNSFDKYCINVKSKVLKWRTFPLYMDIVFFLLRWGSSCIILCNIGTNLICIYISWKIGLHFLLCGEIWLLFVGSKIDALIPGIIKIVTLKSNWYYVYMYKCIYVYLYQLENRVTLCSTLSIRVTFWIMVMVCY